MNKIFDFFVALYLRFYLQHTIKKKIKISIDYYSRVAADANTTPRTPQEQQLEDMLTDALVEAQKEMELDPITMLAMSPQVRQDVAKTLVTVLKKYKVSTKLEFYKGDKDDD